MVNFFHAMLNADMLNADDMSEFSILFSKKFQNSNFIVIFGFSMKYTLK